MTFTRGTALVANIAAMRQLTGLVDLANLESDAELSVANVLTTASDAIYDQLEADGHDPTLISNETVFERAVAWHAAALLVLAGTLEPPEGREFPNDPYAWSDPFYERVRAKLSTGDRAAKPHEAKPSLLNFERKGQFDTSDGIAGTRFNDLPNVQ